MYASRAQRWKVDISVTRRPGRHREIIAMVERPRLLEAALRVACTACSVRPRRPRPASTPRHHDRRAAGGGGSTSRSKPGPAHRHLLLVQAGRAEREHRLFWRCITHLPTPSSPLDEKSQIKNREKAMGCCGRASTRSLGAAGDRSSLRPGSLGDRSEKIRLASPRSA
jgi:hypothetical protein